MAPILIAMRRLLLTAAFAALVASSGARADDRALGVAMAIAAAGECDGIALDLDAVARFIAREEAAAPGFEARATGGLLEGAILRFRTATPVDKAADCAAMERGIAAAGLGR
ncbi:hypothetical protein [Chelativorans alearense]|uniref:hypothetical protein n=1 Tax=Chelativorans alearense TaxID=2681495 RepID=UPI0013D0FBAD|nr:hypothetical protein [Chelativorans alearense]